MPNPIRLAAIGTATVIWAYLLSPYAIAPFARFHSHWIHFTGFGRPLLYAYVICVTVLAISAIWLAIRKDYAIAIFSILTVIVAFAVYPKIKKFREVNMRPNKAMEPTPVNVTVPACAGTAPSTSAAHL